MNDMMTIALGLMIIFLLWVLKMTWEVVVFVALAPLRVLLVLVNFVLGFMGHEPWIPGWARVIDKGIAFVDRKLDEASYNIESAQKARLWMEERKAQKKKTTKASAEVVDS